MTYENKYLTVRDNINFAKCFRCKYEWIPRKEIIKTCAKCRSPYWDTARSKEEYIEMRNWASGVMGNSRYRVHGKATDEKCIDCGEQAKHWEHRNYCRPLLVVPVCQSCNQKRGKSINFS